MAIGPHRCQQMDRLKTSPSPAAGGIHLAGIYISVFALMDLHLAESYKGTGLGHLCYLCLCISIYLLYLVLLLGCAHCYVRAHMCLLGTLARCCCWLCRGTQSCNSLPSLGYWFWQLLT